MHTAIVKCIDINNSVIAELHKVICIWGAEVVLLDLKVKEWKKHDMTE